MSCNRRILYSALVVIIGEKNDWKTKDEMGGWCRSRQRNNRRYWRTKLMTTINGKASEEGQGPAGAAEAIIIITIIMMCY